jgi:hypothetical protein
VKVGYAGCRDGLVGDELVDGVLDAGGAEGLRLADLGRGDG